MKHYLNEEQRKSITDAIARAERWIDEATELGRVVSEGLIVVDVDGIVRSVAINVGYPTGIPEVYHNRNVAEDEAEVLAKRYMREFRVVPVHEWVRDEILRLSNVLVDLNEMLKM